MAANITDRDNSNFQMAKDARSGMAASVHPQGGVHIATQSNVHANGDGASSAADSHHATTAAMSKLNLVTRGEDDVFTKNGASSQLKPSVKPWQPAGKDKVTPMKALNTGSVADTPVIVSSTPELNISPNNTRGKARAIQPPVGSRDNNTPSKTEVNTLKFTTESQYFGDLYGHYLVITGLPMSALTSGAMQHFSELYKINEDTVLDQKLSTRDDSTLLWYLCFDDFNDAIDAQESIKYFDHGITARFCHQTEYFFAHNTQNTHVFDEFEGQLMFWATVKNPKKEYARKDVANAVLAHVEKLGTAEIRNGVHVPAVWCSSSISTPLDDTWKFRVELCKFTDAKRMIELGPIMPDEEPFNDGSKWTFTAVQFVPPYKTVTTPVKIKNKGGDDAGVYHSPTGRTAWTVDDAGEIRNSTAPTKIAKVQATDNVVAVVNPRASAPSVLPPATPTNYFDPDPSAERSESCPALMTLLGKNFPPQVVVVDHIVAGRDVRTTIMLRNLPNQWTCVELKDVLDEIAPGQYDFSYLRIDFHNNMNVGYAFVNFTMPQLIVDFVHRFVGKPWPFQNPSSRRLKHAEVSYATIQGIDCLVEKFRNSAIMDEGPMCRPKLWFTAGNLEGRDVRLIGKEQQMPPPNNLSKKQRSHDNASSIGLFSPANRRATNGRLVRRSNFDRGTPAQIREDAVYTHSAPTSPDYIYAYGSPQGYIVPGPVYVAMPPQYINETGGIVNGDGSPAYGRGRSRNPASTLRTITNGRLGGRPVVFNPERRNAAAGGSMQSPVGFVNGWDFVNAAAPRYSGYEGVGPRDTGL